MSKFGFDPDQYRDTLAQTGAARQVTRVIDDALRQSGALDKPLDYALWYAGLGWYVLPVRADKKPVSGYGLTRATNDPRKIEQIWAENPDAGVAIACAQSGLVVLDIDPRNGGYDTMKRLEAEHGPLKSSTVTLTQGGGEHRYFQAEAGVTYPASLGAGVDVKHNGYVLAEPSRGELGLYRWSHDGCNPTKGSLPGRAPELLRESSTTQRHSSDQLIRPGSIAEPPQVYAELKSALKALPPEMPYDEGWFRVMQGMTRLGDERAAYEMTREWSLRSGNPKHTPEEFDRKWRACSQELYAVTHKSIFHMADERDRSWRGSVKTEADKIEPADLPEVYSLDDFDLSNLPPIKFVIPDWLPAGKLTLFSGHGGSGKSSVMLQLGVLLALGGRQVLGQQLREEPYRVFFVSGEDEPVVNMTRLRGILRLHPDADHDLVAANLKFMNVAGCRTTTLVDFDPRTGKHSYSSLYDHLKKRCAEFQPDLIITDNNSILFGGNEIDRNQIQTYIHCVQNIYPPAAVVALHHVDKASVGREDGDGWSGSTQWHNAARARWTLSLIGEDMTLYLRKSNYGRDGWRGLVQYDETTRAHRLGEFSRLTREEESTQRTERKEQLKQSALMERENEDRVAVLGAIYNAQSRYASAYGILQSLNGRYEAYKKVLTRLIDEGEVLEAALPPGVKGESNRHKTYLYLRDKEACERYKI